MTTALERIQQQASPAPARIGQATAVEQSRAVAQVEAQIVVAMRHPRNVAVATAAMREACAHMRLAEKAFYRFPRGRDVNGKQIIISGPSIHLARELARVWGNIDYGVHEMSRDDDAGQSEVLAFAWDLQTNARNSAVFINPHMRDKSGGPERLTDMRDIYESNANAGARRVREAIFAIMPTWFVEEATDLCSKTLSDGGGKPLAQRVADAIAAFGKLGVATAQIETKLGRKSDAWIDQDVAQLQVIYRSLQRGEIRKEDEFEDVGGRVTGAEILQGAPATVPASTAAEPVSPEPPAPAGEPALPPQDPQAPAVPEQERCTSGQRSMIKAQFARLGFDPEDRGERLKRTTILAGRTEWITSTSDLTPEEALAVRDALKACKSKSDLDGVLQALQQAGSQEQA